MNLKKNYKDIKTRSKGSLFFIQLSAFIAAVLVWAAGAYLINLLWNYLAPIWGLPVLSYPQFLATFTFIKLLSMFLFGFTVTRRRFQGDHDPSIQFMKMIDGFPDEKQ